MSTIFYEEKSVGDVRAAILQMQAKHLAERVFTIFEDYYGKDIVTRKTEIGLEENLIKELALALHELGR